MMSWKMTWSLVGAAVALFLFIVLFERGISPSDAPTPLPGAIVTVKPADVTGLQFRRTNQFVLRAERTNQSWNITGPINYPAEGYAIDHLLGMLSTLYPYAYISPDELKQGKKSVAEFGLDVPMATLTLHHNGRRTDIMFGGRTAVGDQAYVQLANNPGIYVVPAEVVNRLPRTVNDWREIALINVEGLNVDRVEVRNQGRSFAVQANATNRTVR